ncbi:MAG: DUF2231 domain-containing protein [Desulfocapsaceae bacterium]|jgi:uncharacterized membrane protein
MKKWECTICGYIHEGDEPPEVCPVCGAGPEYFKEIIEKAEETVTEAALQPEGEAQDQAQPEVAASPGAAAQPVPGATAAGSQSAAATPSGITALILNLHLHPITVHTPNGVIPLAIVFLVLALVLGFSGFEKAAFYNLVFVLLTMPAVIYTGYVEWQNRYKGAKTKIFGIKIGASIVVLVTLIAMVVWRLIDPEVAMSAGRWTYLGIGLVSVAAAGLAGHMGGKLVFGSRGH